MGVAAVDLVDFWLKGSTGQCARTKGIGEA
jgi:hypothetical protein